MSQGIANKPALQSGPTLPLKESPHTGETDAEIDAERAETALNYRDSPN